MQTNVEISHKNIEKIKIELSLYANTKKGKDLERFFQAYPGGYGEGDSFWGIPVPVQRKIATQYYKDLNLNEIDMLIKEPVHEYRLTAVFVLVLKYEKTIIPEVHQEIIDIYQKNIHYINNWDLVDSSAHKLLGPHLHEKDRSILYEYARSGDLWVQRISMMTTFHFIRNRQYEDTFNLAKILLQHKHDLIHKVVGWMLREIGNRDFEIAFDFVKAHYKQMPRTMLRYAIEKYNEPLRQCFLKDTFD